jgi:hypothetical protein
MKKFLSIGFALLILLSGMQLSLATHICGGHIAAVKWSFAQEKATCGMEDPHATCPTHKTLSSNCCQDEMAVCSTDSNYHLSEIHLGKVYQTVAQIFGTSPHSIGCASASALSLYTNVNPPGLLLVSSVILSDICVFRI